MSGATSPQFPESDQWSDSSRLSRWSGNRFRIGSRRLASSVFEVELSSVDETPEFHDPYSDLNLFLSQKIKSEMHQQGLVKKWSLKIQEALLQKIAPEFQKKFPHYRLGVSALRKTWEKVAYYSQQIETQKEAIGRDGQLNVDFLIRENLRQYPHLTTISGFHPYHYAHQLASKISECIAVVDGIKPSIDQLTRLIWSMQRHILSWSSLQETKSPYDEYDRLDKLIVKTILEISSSEPQISCAQLEIQVQQSLRSLCELPALATQEALLSNVSAIVAEKLYPVLPLHWRLSAEQKGTLLRFLDRQLSLCQSATPAPELNELVRRTLSLYLLAAQLPRDLDAISLKQVTQAVYHHLLLARPTVRQALYAFVSAEIVILQGKGIVSEEEICSAIWTAYDEARQLPVLQPDELELLEVVIWKNISEKQGLLERLPYRIGQKIEIEVAWQLIDRPSLGFTSLVHHTVRAFQKNKEIATSKKETEIERKIHIWCLQGDLLCRCVRFDQEMPLIKMILQLFDRCKKEERILSHADFISEVCQSYLKQYPSLGCYGPQVFMRVSTLYKYAWYTHFSLPQESSVDRFVKWHGAYCVPEEKFRALFIESLPLIPFPRIH